jgi:UDP-N-acetylmuramoyl-tripeptide--D-alanyl-D-alanine ligase
MIDGVQVIEDCYNASPSATVAAIQSFSELANANRRVLLLGEMFELGAFAEEGHRRVGRAAAASASDLVVCVGDQANWIADELIAHGAPVCHVNVVEDAVEVLRTWLRPGDAILVKGSRAARLERAVEQLRTARLAEHATIVEGDAV